MTDDIREPGPEQAAEGDLEQALAAYLAAQRMTRRQLLERIAAVGAAAALAPVIAACAAGPTVDPSRTKAPAGEPRPTLPASTAGESLPAAPAQAAAASSHVISRILARIVSRG